MCSYGNRRDSPVMTLPAPSSPPSSADPSTPESWSAWATKTATSVMRLSLREVSQNRGQSWSAWALGNKDCYVGDEAQSERGESNISVLHVCVSYLSVLCSVHPFLVGSGCLSVGGIVVRFFPFHYLWLPMCLTRYFVVEISHWTRHHYQLGRHGKSLASHLHQRTPHLPRRVSGSPLRSAAQSKGRSYNNDNNDNNDKNNDDENS